MPLCSIASSFALASGRSPGHAVVTHPPPLLTRSPRQQHGECGRIHRGPRRGRYGDADGPRVRRSQRRARARGPIVPVRRHDLPRGGHLLAPPRSKFRACRRVADGIPITLVSDSLTEQDTGPWREQTTIVRRSDAHEAVARLREQDGDALIFGSRTLWTDLLAHGLVDELHLMIGPKIVAGDHHAFAGVPETELRLLDVRRWDDSDNVVLRDATAPA
jgi:riboflavin biosynthesis pyrimidine reductase